MTIFIRKRYYGFFVFAILVIVISIYQFRNSEATLDYKIGLISNNPNGIRNVIGFKDALSSLGYVEDINTTYIFSGKPNNQVTKSSSWDSVLNTPPPRFALHAYNLWKSS